VHALVERHHERTKLARTTHEAIEDQLWQRVVQCTSDDDLVAAIALGVEERAVSGGEQRFERFSVFRCGRYTNGQRHRHRAVGFFAERNRQRSGRAANLFGERASASGIEAWEQHDEFVTSVPADVLPRSQHVAHDARHQTQRVVTRKVTEGVVHRLELVDVDDEQRYLRTRATTLGEHGRRHVHERATNERTVRSSSSDTITVLIAPGAAQWCSALCCRRRTHRSATYEILEQLEELRVELAADLAPHDLDSFELREGALVAPLRRQCVVNVGDAENARLQRNLLRHETVGITMSIPALVVTAHHRRDVPRELHVGKHLLAGGGMLAE
jgi:hypothetical protein